MSSCAPEAQLTIQWASRYLHMWGLTTRVIFQHGSGTFSKSQELAGVWGPCAMLLPGGFEISSAPLGERDMYSDRMAAATPIYTPLKLWSQRTAMTIVGLDDKLCRCVDSGAATQTSQGAPEASLKALILYIDVS